MSALETGQADLDFQATLRGCTLRPCLKNFFLVKSPGFEDLRGACTSTWLWNETVLQGTASVSRLRQCHFWPADGDRHTQSHLPSDPASLGQKVTILEHEDAHFWSFQTSLGSGREECTALYKMSELERPQWLKAHTALVQDLSSVPTIHISPKRWWSEKPHAFLRKVHTPTVTCTCSLLYKVTTRDLTVKQRQLQGSQCLLPPGQPILICTYPDT